MSLKSWWDWELPFTLMLILTLAGIGLLAVPEYRLRAQIINVFSGWQEGRTTMMTEYAWHHRFPGQDAAALESLGQTFHQPQIRLHEDAVLVRIDSQPIDSPSPNLAEDFLHATPFGAQEFLMRAGTSSPAAATIVWQCGSNPFPDSVSSKTPAMSAAEAYFLPASCRRTHH